ncbi:MAG: hypothetical protein KDA62_17580 [Planctomycetales bacterium]|nr:hypothetical protein [Planctomycetales bacterium]MCA9228160.1 hypothetical protein [Planctomycetales bacterium]
MPNFSLRKVQDGNLKEFGRAHIVPPNPRTNIRYTAYVRPRIDRTVLSAYLAAAFGVKEGDDIVIVLVSDMTSEAHELPIHVDKIEPDWPDLMMIVSWDQLMSQFAYESEDATTIRLTAINGSCFMFQKRISGTS